MSTIVTLIELLQVLDKEPSVKSHFNNEIGVIQLLHSQAKYKDIIQYLDMIVSLSADAGPTVQSTVQEIIKVLRQEFSHEERQIILRQGNKEINKLLALVQKLVVSNHPTFFKDYSGLIQNRKIHFLYFINKMKQSDSPHKNLIVFSLEQALAKNEELYPELEIIIQDTKNW